MRADLVFPKPFGTLIVHPKPDTSHEVRMRAPDLEVIDSRAFLREGLRAHLNPAALDGHDLVARCKLPRGRPAFFSHPKRVFRRRADCLGLLRRCRVLAIE